MPVEVDRVEPDSRRVPRLALEEIDVRYARYRLTALEAEEAMGRSLRRYGQIALVVVCLREEVPVLVDGFKRLAAA